MVMPKKSILWFCGATLLSVLAVTVLYIVGVTYIGRGYCTFDFVRVNLGVKLYRLAHSTSPRLIVMSGSNSQSNLDSDMLAKTSGRDAVNLGIIWVMPLRFYLPMIEDVVGKGDVVLLPLELTHYKMQSSALRSPFSVSVAFGVYPRVLTALSLREQVELYLKNGLGWLQCVVPKRCPVNTLVQNDPASDYAGWLAGEKSDAPLHMTGRGDFVTKCGASFDENKRPPKYTTLFTEEFLDSLNRLREFVERRGARLILAHTPKYDYLDATTLADFDRAVRGLGLPVVGDPRALCLPYGYFTDGDMHGNVLGRELYSHEIVKSLAPLLGKNVPSKPDWPLVVFDRGQGARADFAQPARCVGAATFGEFIVDRGSSSVTNVIEKVLINGKPVPFVEKVHANKNAVWVCWGENKKNLSVEVIGNRRSSGVQLERVLMEPDMSDRVTGVTDFTDISPVFIREGKRYVCRAGNAEEAHLIVKLRKWQSNRYRMVVRAKCCVTSGRIQIGGCGYKKDVALHPDASGEDAFKIAFIETSAYINKDGDAEIGLYFPPGSLNPGDGIEVVDLKFERL